MSKVVCVSLSYVSGSYPRGAHRHSIRVLENAGNLQSLHFLAMRLVSFASMSNSWKANYLGLTVS
jgi:hypothetical protein